MRFLNWDVLLFPEDSKIPIQEFEVKCYAIPVSSDASQPSHSLAISGASYQMCVTQMPTLTGFIPSLESGRTFRVSIHSWEKPQPSDLLRQVRPDASRVVYETQLYIDGKLKAQKYLEEHGSWPEVIEYESRRTYDPLPMPLRFPPFRPELLQQSHWDAGDDLGRIRLVITEGVTQSHSLLNGHGFDKVRDVVVFSFQHAPKHILEYSGIAWPNARMFQKTPGKVLPQPDMDAHAHSPQRSKKPIMGPLGAKTTQKQHVGPTSLQSSKWASRLTLVADDPFVAPTQSSSNQRKTSGDVSMLDCPTKSRSDKDTSEMSGVMTPQLDFHQQVERASVEEILKELSPGKRQALMKYLSPPSQSEANPVKKVKTLAICAADSDRNLLNSDISAAHRRSSTGSRRSTSGQSTSMSWEGTPTFGGLLTSNEYPGLLPTIQSQPAGIRTSSSGPKRKRSASPVRIDVETGATLPMVKDMSTSPCKDATTPSRNGKVMTSNSHGNIANRD